MYSGAPSSVQPHDGAERKEAAIAHLLGWCVLALLDTLFIFFWFDERSWTRAALHHFYDAGQLIGLGLIAASLAWASRRIWRSAGGGLVKWFGRGTLVVVLGALAAAVGELALSSDLAGFTARQAEKGSSLPWHWIAVVAITGATALGGSVVWFVSRYPWGRIVALVVGLAIAIANQFVLPQSYPGIHLYLAIAAALAIAAGLRNVRVKGRPLFKLAGIAVLGAWAVTSLVLLPGARVRHDIFRLPGAVAAPFVSRFHPVKPDPAQPPSSASSRAKSAWYSSRENAPDVPPTPRSKELPKSPIVLLVTADAIRTDLVRQEKYARRLPHLHALRDASVDFTRAWSPSPSTATTFTALYTGKYYSATRWKGRTKKLEKKGAAIWPTPDKTPRVPKLLSDAGADTVNMRMLNMFSKGSGICRGFSEHIEVGHYAPGKKGIRKLIRRLRKQDDAPLFAAIHLIDPHAPYTRGSKNEPKGSKFERYVGEVAYVDRQLGELLKEIKRPRFRDRAILIFASDHGEAFGEHGSYFHARTMYEELLRVPLFVYSASFTPRKIHEPVSLIDLGPTLLDLFDQPTPGWFMGQSLVPFLLGREVELTRPIAAEAGRRMQAMVFPDGYKAIVDLRRNTEEVYDLTRDPEEENNLARTSGRANRALADLHRFFAAHELEDYEPPWRNF